MALGYTTPKLLREHFTRLIEGLIPQYGLRDGSRFVSTERTETTPGQRCRRFSIKMNNVRPMASSETWLHDGHDRSLICDVIVRVDYAGVPGQIVEELADDDRRLIHEQINLEVGSLTGFIGLEDQDDSTPYESEDGTLDGATVEFTYAAMYMRRQSSIVD